MKVLTKKILNTALITTNIQDQKPKKTEAEMTYFKLLMDLIEREEFLYAWLCSDSLFSDLENIFEVHMPS